MLVGFVGHVSVLWDMTAWGDVTACSDMMTCHDMMAWGEIVTWDDMMTCADIRIRVDLTTRHEKFGGQFGGMCRFCAKLFHKFREKSNKVVGVKILK